MRNQVVSRLTIQTDLIFLFRKSRGITYFSTHPRKCAAPSIHYAELCVVYALSILYYTRARKRLNGVHEVWMSESELVRSLSHTHTFAHSVRIAEILVFVLRDLTLDSLLLLLFILWLAVSIFFFHFFLVFFS